MEEHLIFVRYVKPNDSQILKPVVLVQMQTHRFSTGQRSEHRPQRRGGERSKEGVCTIRIVSFTYVFRICWSTNPKTFCSDFVYELLFDF